MSPKPRTSALLWSGLALLGLGLAQAVAVGLAPSAPWTQGIDDAWRQLVGVGAESGAHGWILPLFFHHLGGPIGGLVLMILVPAVLAIIGRWRTALFLVAAQLAGPGLVSQTLKNLVDRPRPAADVEQGLYGPLYLVDHGSFPSGHSMMPPATWSPAR